MVDACGEDPQAGVDRHDIVSVCRDQIRILNSKDALSVKASDKKLKCRCVVGMDAKRLTLVHRSKELFAPNRADDAKLRFADVDEGYLRTKIDFHCLAVHDARILRDATILMN